MSSTRKTKEYSFKKRTFYADYFILMLMISLIIYIAPLLFQAPVAFLLLIVVPGYIFFFLIYGILHVSQYNKIDDGKRITINPERTVLTVEQHAVVINIKREDVKDIDLFVGKSLGKFTNLTYLIINTNDEKQILITELTIPGLAYDNILTSFLRKKPRRTFRKNLNFIKGVSIC